MKNIRSLIRQKVPFQQISDDLKCFVLCVSYVFRFDVTVNLLAFT